ncbi:ABC transporter permease [Actinoplanes sp. NPDC026619]|uniref:ABC transporter permease n=1 Tax=Actinoplanes sp. NPDC026619 TaxID=3155798 RepID=UPI0033C6FFB5
MTLRRTVAAELRKTATLPGSFGAAAVAVLGTLGITIINALSVRGALRAGQPDRVAYTSPAEAVFSAVPLITVGAVILGVIVISSEYTANSPDAGGSRQITTTLAATPHRLTVIAAKVAALTVHILVTAAITIPACLTVAHLVIGTPFAADALGSTVARAAGAALYWTLTGLVALAITVLTRSGIIPLIVGIVNSSLVSASVLLTHVTSLAYYLPDLAGMRLIADDQLGMFEEALDPLTGALVMAAWALGFLAFSAVVFIRRDA